MNGFHLFEDSKKEGTKEIIYNAYEFNCFKNRKFKEEFRKFKTKKIKFENSSKDIDKLLELKVKCPNDYLLFKFSLSFSDQKEMFYRYKCVSVDVDNDSCIYFDSNKINLSEFYNRKNNKDKNNEKFNIDILKHLYVNAIPGRFIKNFKLEYNKEENELFYKFNSCKLELYEKEDDDDGDILGDDEEDDYEDEDIREPNPSEAITGNDVYVDPSGIEQKYIIHSYNDKKMAKNNNKILGDNDEEEIISNDKDKKISKFTVGEYNQNIRDKIEKLSNQYNLNSSNNGKVIISNIQNDE